MLEHQTRLATGTSALVERILHLWQAGSGNRTALIKYSGSTGTEFFREDENFLQTR